MNILIVEDEKINRVTLEDALAGAGYSVASCGSAEEGTKLARQNGFSLAIVDLKLPGMDGMGFLESVRESAPHVEVILITAYGSIPLAVQAMKSGAYDFLTKPFSTEELILKVGRFFETQRLKEENVTLRKEIEKVYSFEELVARSPKMQEVFEQAGVISPSSSTVLLLGESGTGKELMARAVHLRSKRSGHFVPVACAAIPATLMESELFGHEKGAFTDARQARAGKVEAAHEGTLFLDDIDALPLALQPKVLRFLETREFTRLGSTVPRKVDARIIAAARPNLHAMVKEERFRDDLFYRLNVLVLHLPPLRQRREDIPLLAHHFIRVLGKRIPSAVKSISREAMQILLSHDFPGNVRELEHLIERVLHFARSEEIQPSDLPRELLSPPPSWLPDNGFDSIPASYPIFVENLERSIFAKALRESVWSVSEAARRLDIPRTTLSEKIKKYDLKPDGIRQD